MMTKAYRKFLESANALLKETTPFDSNSVTINQMLNKPIYAIFGTNADNDYIWNLSSDGNRFEDPNAGTASIAINEMMLFLNPEDAKQYINLHPQLIGMQAGNDTIADVFPIKGILTQEKYDMFDLANIGNNPFGSEDSSVIDWIWTEDV